MVKEAKSKSWKDFGEQMERDAAGNDKMLYRTIRGLQKAKKNPIRDIKYEQGQISFEKTAF